MKRCASDPAGDMLSALVDELDQDRIELGQRVLKVWRERSPAVVMQSEERGENPVATAAGFMDMMLDSLGSEADLSWSDCEQRSREYGRRRARQAVPLESLLDELGVYRRATMELISTPLHNDFRRDEIVALAQSRLEDVTDHLTQAIVAGYFDGVEAGRLNTSRVATRVGAVVGHLSYLSQAATKSLGKNFAARRLRARTHGVKVKVAPPGDADRRLARSFTGN